VGDSVFANAQSIACKASAGKVIACLPDTCLSPPPPPTGPVPVPYPNTAMASDLADGSKDVKIEGQPVFLGDQSSMSTSSGDEAGTQGGGVLSHKTKGKVYFCAWSMDVKFEGTNVPRNIDMTQNNGASFPRNTATWPFVAAAHVASGEVTEGPCEGVDSKFMLQPKKKVESPDTGHHLVPHRTMGDGAGAPNYSYGDAPCLVTQGTNQYAGTHGACHEVFDAFELDKFESGETMSYSDARDTAAESAKGVNDDKELTPKEQECIKYQLDNYYKKECGMKNSTALRTSGAPGKNIV